MRKFVVGIVTVREGQKAVLGRRFALEGTSAGPRRSPRDGAHGAATQTVTCDNHRVLQFSSGGLSGAPLDLGDAQFFDGFDEIGETFALQDDVLAQFFRREIRVIVPDRDYDLVMLGE